MGIEYFEINNPKNEYYYFRWKYLRQPFGQSLGSEKDDKENESYHFIAKFNDEIIAVARLHKISANTGQVRFMAVDSKFTGRNIGTEILYLIEKKTVQIGLDELILNARESVIPFYQKNGFQVVEKSHILFDRIQHYLMRKEISSSANSSK